MFHTCMEIFGILLELVYTVRVKYLRYTKRNLFKKRVLWSFMRTGLQVYSLYALFPLIKYIIFI